ncbi:hypothetical protein FOMPIDRAFT_117309 [Fomitopsis schrenkii]|uniref:Uncharacterized protein n=1 Tax=Fomitopsis schrenkii TaxID=2126942 RepID=S8F8F8_FOMSC|nr:hypothetical protein FOMPIDRAFT_117309 [Fomitopsis schrenkii]
MSSQTMKVKSSTAVAPSARAKTLSPRGDQSGAHYALPPLSLGDMGEPVIVLAVRKHPELGHGRSLTWIVDERPNRRVGYGHLVSLRTQSGSTGTGMLEAITSLSRYWVTWTVSDDRNRCAVRIPISWSELTGIAAVAHAKHYDTLPRLPPPHTADPVARLTPQHTTYPYDSNLTTEERVLLNTKLRSITNV